MNPNAVKKIKSVQFGMFTDHQLEKIGIEINLPHSHNGNTTNTPADKRLGTLDNFEICGNCGLNAHDCTGHMGYIRLAVPVYNPKCMTYITSLLKCVCTECSALLAPEISESFKLEGNTRLRVFREKCEKVTECRECGAKTMKISEKKCVITFTDRDGGEGEIVTPKKVREILKGISNETMEILGFNRNLNPIDNEILEMIDIDSDISHPHQIRPESFVFNLFPVIPPQARPYIITEGERKEDDLTEVYNIIIKHNNAIFEKLNPSATTVQKKKGKASMKTIEKSIADLERYIYMIIDNKKAKCGAGERKTKGLTDRVSGKNGNIQSNVGGKRVDQSARTVIVGAGPDLYLNEVGIPQFVAETNTVAELVTCWNIHHLTTLLQNKKVNGVRRNGHIINVKTVTQNFTLPFIWNGVEGLLEKDTVERHIQNGDPFLLNRQPTLRAESMQGVVAKILPPGEMVWRLPLGVTPPYNADFDGDRFCCQQGA